MHVNIDSSSHNGALSQFLRSPMNWLFAFILVCVGILILRKREPNRPRAFKTPWVPFVPVAGIVSCFYLMMGLPWVAWIRFALWLAIGLVIYFMYGYKRSGLRNQM